LLAAAACRQSTASAPQLMLDAADGDPSHASIKVVGLAPREVAALRAREMSVDEWHAILRVTVARDDGGVAPQPDLPAVAGKYAIAGDSIVLTPMFGLDPGRR
jgi:hypothetical protein